MFNPAALILDKVGEFILFSRDVQSLKLILNN